MGSNTNDKASNTKNNDKLYQEKRKKLVTPTKKTNEALKPMETGLQDSSANKLLETAYLSLLFYISAIFRELPSSTSASAKFKTKTGRSARNTGDSCRPLPAQV